MNRGSVRGLIGLGGLATAVYAFIIRPRMLAWGSTVEEQTRPLPGDEIEPNAGYVTTRATTIQAPAGSVWPWLIQMGQDRAGFYTHNWIERMLQSGIPDTAEIRPEWQHLEVGDLMRTNRDIGGKPMGWPVVALDPGRSLVVTSKSMPVGTYAFVLEPIDVGACRLIVRDRARWQWWEWPFARLVYEPLHAYMETGLIRGVRRRAERATSGRRRTRETRTPANEAGVVVVADVRHPVAIVALKTVHTFIFAGELSAILWLVVSGLLGRRDRTVGIAAGAVAVEAGVFLANDGVCPITPLTERLGAVRGAVSDIFLPDAMARTTPAWSTALLMLAGLLHLRSLISRAN
jgi:hypothetical protein